MKDFIIGLIITIITNILIINPYWDTLKEYWLHKGYTAEQINTPYILLCVASYFAVGIVSYAVLYAFKKIINKKAIDIN